MLSKRFKPQTAFPTKIKYFQNEKKYSIQNRLVVGIRCISVFVVLCTSVQIHMHFTNTFNNELTTNANNHESSKNACASSYFPEEMYQL